MRKGTIRNLIEQYEVQAGDNKKRVGQMVGDKLASFFESGKLEPADVSIKALFEEVVDPEGNFDMHSDVQELAEAISTSNFSTISGTVMNAAIIPAYQAEVGEAAKIVTELPAVKTAPEEIGGFTSPGGFAQRHENMSYEEESFGEKYWTIYKSDFGKIVSLTREAIFDDRTGQLISRAKGVGEKGGQLRAKIITQTLEVAARTDMNESSSYAAVYGGSAVTAANFYNTDHSALIDSAGTNANLVTSNALGTSGNLQNAAQLFPEFVDEAGDKMMVRPTKLMFHPALSETAWETLSARVKRGQNNDIENFWYKKYEPVELGFLTSGTTWFLGAPERQLVWLWVWKPEVKSQTANSESAFQSQIVMRWRFNWFGGCGHTDYRYIVKNTA